MSIANKEHYIYTDKECFHNDSKLVRGFIKYNFNEGMHLHEFYEINIILNGVGYHYLGNNMIRAGKGDVFVVAPGVKHGYVSEGNFDIYVLLLSKKFMRKFGDDFKKLECFRSFFSLTQDNEESQPQFHLKLDNKQLNQCESLMNMINLQKFNSDYAESLCNAHIAVSLITYFCEEYKKNLNYFVHNESESGITKAIALIHDKYNEKITIERLSKCANLSRNTFIKKFVKVYSTPPITYLINVRLDAAKKLIADTQYTIAQIAELTGFYDISHFVKTFYANVGCTPDEFKRFILK